MFIDSHAHMDMTLSDLDPSFSLKEKTDLLLPPELDWVNHISLNADDFLIHYPFFSSYPKILFSTGIYPSTVTKKDFHEDQEISKLEQVLTQYHHIALGEAGMDFKDDSYGSPKAQASLFEKQIALAEKLALPIVIHSRFSFEECYQLLDRYPKVPAIIHCFSYSIQEAERSLKRGDFVSFTGLLTYPKSKELHEVAQMVPLDKVLFETDSPYLSPVPYRGKTNVPSYVEHTYRFFAQLRNMDIEELCSIVHNNTKVAFRLPINN